MKLGQMNLVAGDCLMIRNRSITDTMTRLIFPTALAIISCVSIANAAPLETAVPTDGSVLPFPPVPSASIAAPRLQDSSHQRRPEQNHLSRDAPNVLIILLDDVGFGQASTFGGEINTPTLSKLADQGISYNTLPHHCDLLADARGVVDRAQSSACRQWHDRRARCGLGRLYRRHSENLRDDGGGLARLRVQDGGDRQMAQYARRSNHLDGSIRSLADRAWLRLFLWLSSPARRRSGSRGWSRIPTRSSRRTTRNIT